MADKLTQDLYGGKVSVTFFPESHRYKLAGRSDYLISATAATGIVDKSRFLIDWAVKLTRTHLLQHLENNTGPFTLAELWPVIEEACVQHSLKKQAAATIGDQVHQFAEDFAKAKISSALMLPDPAQYLLGDEEQDEKIMNGINAFIDWYTTHDVQFLYAERLIYSLQHDYTGLCDVGLMMDGKRLVGDYKTGKGIYNEFYYQLSAYWGAIEEEDETQYDGGVILHFNKEDGSFKVAEVSREEHLRNFETFLHCLGIKRREKELNKLAYV